MNEIVSVAPPLTTKKSQFMPKRNRCVALRLTKAQMRELRIAAARTDFSVPALIRTALRAYLRDKLNMRFPCETEC